MSYQYFPKQTLIITGDRLTSLANRYGHAEFTPSNAYRIMDQFRAEFDVLPDCEFYSPIYMGAVVAFALTKRIPEHKGIEGIKDYIKTFEASWTRSPSPARTSTGTRSRSLFNSDPSTKDKKEAPQMFSAGLLRIGWTWRSDSGGHPHFRGAIIHPNPECISACRTSTRA